jgi:hypothetical protein
MPEVLGVKRMKREMRKEYEKVYRVNENAACEIDASYRSD